MSSIKDYRLFLEAVEEEQRAFEFLTEQSIEEGFKDYVRNVIKKTISKQDPSKLPSVEYGEFYRFLGHFTKGTDTDEPKVVLENSEDEAKLTKQLDSDGFNVTLSDGKVTLTGTTYFEFTQETRYFHVILAFEEGDNYPKRVNIKSEEYN